MRRQNKRLPLGIALMLALYCCLVCKLLQAADPVLQPTGGDAAKAEAPTGPSETARPGKPDGLNTEGRLPHPGGSGGDMRGACCIPAPGTPGFCVMLDPMTCAAEGGIFQGPGTTCQDPNIGCFAPPVAPCCFSDGSCAELPIFLCEAEGGRPRPNADACDTVECGPATELGACCIQTNAGFNGCLILSEPLCELNGGVFLGTGVGCDSAGVDCPPQPIPLGACCLIGPCDEVLCVETLPQLCEAAGGVFAGPGTSCDDPNIPCHRPPDIGACCMNLPGSRHTCVMWPEDRCIQEGGLFQGPGTFCDDPDIDCYHPPHIGACCIEAPGSGMVICVEVPAEVCIAEGGEYQGDGVSCDDPNVPCHRPMHMGACCIADSAGAIVCVMAPAPICIREGGVFQGPGTHCDDPNIVCDGPPAFGACCISDVGIEFCVMAPEALCIAEGGVYQGDGTSCGDPSIPCAPPPVGACCLDDGSCHEVPFDVCMGQGGTPMPPGTPCDIVDCLPSGGFGACCIVLPGGVPICFEMTEADCAAEQGDFLGDGTDCGGDPTDPIGPCRP